MDILHEQQKGLKLSEDPVFKSEIVQNKMNEISAKLSAIMKMTKPKEGHKDKPDKAGTAKEDQGEATKSEADKGTKKEEKEAEEL